MCLPQINTKKIDDIVKEAIKIEQGSSMVEVKSYEPIKTATKHYYSLFDIDST